MLVDYVGYLAALLSSLCWIPQAVQILRTRDTRSLSLPTNLLLLSAVSLWLIYGLMLGDWPIIIANVISVSFVGMIVIAKLIYK